MTVESDPHITVSINLAYLSGILGTLTTQQLSDLNIPLRLSHLRVERLEAAASIVGGEVGGMVIPAGNFALKGQAGPPGGEGPGDVDPDYDVGVWLRARRLSEVGARLAGSELKQVAIGDVRIDNVEASAMVEGRKPEAGTATAFAAAPSELRPLTPEQMMASLVATPPTRSRVRILESVPRGVAGLKGLAEGSPHIVVLIRNSYVNEALRAFVEYLGPYLVSTVNSELVKWARPSNLLRLQGIRVRVDDGIIKLETLLKFDLGMWQPDVTAIADLDVSVQRERIDLRVVNVGLSGASIADLPRWMGGNQIRSTARGVLDWLVGKFVAPQVAPRVKGKLPAPLADCRYEIVHYESRREYQMVLADIVAAETG